MNTRALKSLAYGPGVLKNALIGVPVEFVIQARNDLNENRVSGNDEFKVVICSSEDRKKKIENTLVDRGDGSYLVTYQADEPGDYEIEINFMNDKQLFVPIRGSPYVASFCDGGKATDNSLTGGIMAKQIQKEIERLSSSLSESKKETITKGKELDDIKVVLGIKESVEAIKRDENEITLQIDQLEESLKLFQAAKLSKDSQLKSLNKIHKEWVDVKKIAKETKKEIEPKVSSFQDTNNFNIKRLEEDITTFTQEMKKREFFQYACGSEQAVIKLEGVFKELTDFEDSIQD